MTFFHLAVTLFVAVMCSNLSAILKLTETSAGMAPVLLIF